MPVENLIFVGFLQNVQEFNDALNCLGNGDAFASFEPFEHEFAEGERLGKEDSVVVFAAANFVV